MEVRKLRRRGTGAYVNGGMLSDILDQVTAGCILGNTIQLRRSQTLPATVSVPQTVAGASYGYSGAPKLLPASSAGMDIFFWYQDAGTVLWYSEAATVAGMPATFDLPVPGYTYTGTSAMLNGGGWSFRLYLMTSGTLTVSDMVIGSAWLLGGGGGGGDTPAAGYNVAGEVGAGGGGGGRRTTVTFGLTAGESIEITIGAGGSHSAAGGTTSLGSVASATGGSGGGDASSATRGGAGGAGGSGGGGGGGCYANGGAGGTNGAAGKNGKSGSQNSEGNVTLGGTGGSGSSVSGYAFSDSAFDGVLRGSGGAGNGGKGNAGTVTAGAANTGDGGRGAAGHGSSTRTGYHGGKGGSGLIILQGAVTGIQTMG